MSVNASTMAGKKHSPLPRMIIGVGLLVFWLAAVLLQIATTEAFFEHHINVSYVPDFGLLNQPFDFIGGHLTTALAIPVFIGWGIELIFFACIIGYELGHEGITHMNQGLSPWFRTGLIVVVGFQGWTDFNYSPDFGFWGSAFFALFTSFVVGFVGIWGWRLLEHSFGEVRR